MPTAIMDDDGALLPTNESGEIVYRGPHAPEGYRATDAAFAHGGFRSGGIGHLGAEVSGARDDRVRG